MTATPAAATTRRAARRRTLESSGGDAPAPRVGGGATEASPYDTSRSARGFYQGTAGAADQFSAYF
eukprot:525171-Heterocapsa_arctica.AAC.1